MPIITFLFHVLLDYFLGRGILSHLKKDQLPFGYSFIAILLGMFAETTLSFVFIWIGFSLKIALLIISSLALIFNYKDLIHFFKNYNSIIIDLKLRLQFPKKIQWYESLFLILIFQKIGIIVWQLFRTPTFQSDAIKHWSTQALAIYSGFNFSMISSSPHFLGKKLQLVHDYPFQLPIWRANSAILNGGWNEFISRSDGLLFFIIICGIVGSVMWTLTQKRWITLGFIFIIASLPLQVWHGAAGYADIAVEAYLAVAIACFIGKEWLLCGLFMAGAVWNKNDGLAIYFPGVIVGVFVFHFFKKGIKLPQKLRKISHFIIGFSFILPWLIFQSLHSNSILNKIFSPIKKLFSQHYYDSKNYKVVLTQAGKRFENSPPSYELFWDYVFTGSTFGIFWIAIGIGLIILSKRLFLDQIGRGLLLFILITSTIIYYVFTYTPAYEYLLIQTTIHRVLLQFSAATLLVVGYGVSLLGFKKH